MIVIKEDRTMDRVREQAKKWKKQIREASGRRSRDYIVSMWMGYLNGLRMADVITYDEYIALYEELKDYAAGADLVRERKTVTGL